VRRALRGDGDDGAAWITFTDGRYRLVRALAGPDGADGPALDCDVDAVLAAAAALRLAERRRQPLDAAALDALAGTLARRRGALGEGLVTGDWLLPHEDHVRAAWSEATEALARRWMAAGEPAEALAAAERVLAVEPLRESAHRLRMEALAARGETARALAHYDTLVALLAAELGARPTRETQAAADALRRSRVGATR
jgi:DNA-binding SARP family transcriptional activator